MPAIVVRPGAKRRRLSGKTLPKHAVVPVRFPLLPVVSSLELLGATISLQKQRKYELQNSRALRAAHTAERVAHVPIPVDGMCALHLQHLSTVMASSLVRLPLPWLPHSRWLLSGPCGDAVHGRHWRSACLHFPSRGGKFIRAWSGSLNRLHVFADSCYDTLSWVILFVRAWAAVRDDESSLLPTHFRIVAKLLRVVKVVGWTWPEPFVLCTDWQLYLSILYVDKGLWEHEVRRAARRHMWSTLAMRIPKYADLAKGIDTWASLRLLKSKVLAGATLPCGRLWRAGILCSPACPLCGAFETCIHMMWTCPRQKHIRNRCLEETGPVDLLADSWPSAQSRLAVKPENPNLLQQWRRIHL